MTFVLVDPPSPPGFIAFRHSHGGYGELCRGSRLRLPCLDILHAAGALLEGGQKAAVVDCVVEGRGTAAGVEAVLRERPSIAAVRTASGSCPHDLRFAALLKRRFKGPVLFFGPQAALETPALLGSRGVDAVVLGDPGPVLLRAARKGLREGAGLLISPAARVPSPAPLYLPRAMRSVPIPPWHLVPRRKYSYLTSQTSWGCPHGCGYCPYPLTQGRRWLARPAAAVVREFQALRRLYGARFVMLRDPLFSFDRKRAVRLCRALIRAGVPLLWGCETRLDHLDEALVALMSRAGCIRVVFGVESVRGDVLRRVGGGRPGPEHVRRMTACLKKHGMLTYAFYMLGLPGETTASSMETLAFARELGTEAASFSAATPFHGTRLAALARRERRFASRDTLHLTSCVPSMRNEDMSAAEIARLYRLAKRSRRERGR